MPEISTNGVIKADIPAQSTVLNPHNGLQSQVSDPSRAATTTFQEDLTTAGQRRINLIWEYTQALIAIIVVITTMVVSALTAYYQNQNVNAQVPNLIAVAFGTVVGFYFSRTNHAAIGGIGTKPESQYVGR
jgi:hypothetical protein